MHAVTGAVFMIYSHYDYTQRPCRKSSLICPRALLRCCVHRRIEQKQYKQWQKVPCFAPLEESGPTRPPCSADFIVVLELSGTSQVLVGANNVVLDGSKKFDFNTPCVLCVFRLGRAVWSR